MASFEKAIGVVLEHEGDGGGRAVPGDPGGATRWGVTQTTLLRARRVIRGLPEHVRDLTRAQAVTIYKALWWDAAPYALLTDDGVATKLFDLAVNVGEYRAHRFLWFAAEALGLIRAPTDGSETGFPVELAEAANRANPGVLVSLLKQRQRDHYARWIAQAPEREKFRKGLMRRADWPPCPSQAVPS